MAHTKGSWKVVDDGTLTDKYLTVYVNDENWDEEGHALFHSETIATSRDSGETWNDVTYADEIKANVALAATAPNLLEACQRLYDNLLAIQTVLKELENWADFQELAEMDDDIKAALSAARAAFAKARGGEACMMDEDGNDLESEDDCGLFDVSGGDKGLPHESEADDSLFYEDEEP